MQRLHRLARVGGDAVFDFVPSGGGPVRLALVRGDIDLEPDFHGQRVDLRFGLFREAAGGGFAFGGQCGGGFAVFRGGVIDFGAKAFQNLIAIFDFRKFAGDIFAEGQDLGDRLAVFALEAIEDGEAVFNLGEAVRAGVDALGVIAKAGGDVVNDGARGLRAAARTQ